MIFFGRFFLFSDEIFSCCSRISKSLVFLVMFGIFILIFGIFTCLLCLVNALVYYLRAVLMNASGLSGRYSGGCNFPASKFDVALTMG